MVPDITSIHLKRHIRPKKTRLCRGSRDESGERKSVYFHLTEAGFTGAPNLGAKHDFQILTPYYDFPTWNLPDRRSNEGQIPRKGIREVVESYNC